MASINSLRCDQAHVISALFLHILNMSLALQLNEDHTAMASREYYGGILDEFISLPANDTDLVPVTEFAVDFARKRHPHSLSFDERGQVLSWQVTEPKKLKLRFTSDGIRPFVLEEILEGPNGPRLHRRQAILGITYIFTLTWPTRPSSYHHRFVINKDREKRLSVYAHQFYHAIRVIDPGAGSGQSPLTPSMELPRSVPMGHGSCSERSDCGSQIVTDGLVGGADGGPTGLGQSESGDVEACNVWKRNRDGEEAIEGSHYMKDKPVFGQFMTYNIWNFNSLYPGEKKFYNHRMKQMGKLLVNSHSDIIGMQEVRYDHEFSNEPGPCQVSQLAEHLCDYQFVYQPANTFWKNHLGRAEEGVAIFSQHPILSTDFLPLPRNQSDPEDAHHQRICLHAEVEHPVLGIVHVFVTHLSLSEAARERSVVEIWRYMQRSSGLSVLMGDMNAQPHEASMRFLRGEIELQGHRTEGLVDAWRVLHDEPRPDAPGTYQDNEPRDPGLTFSALNKHLNKRIDYLYIRLTDDTKLVDVSLVDDGLRAHKAASDHIGVSAVVAPSYTS